MASPSETGSKTATDRTPKRSPEAPPLGFLPVPRMRCVESACSGRCRPPSSTAEAASSGPPRSHPRRAPSPLDVSHVLRGFIFDVRATIFASLTCFGLSPFEAFLLRTDVPVIRHHGDPSSVFLAADCSEAPHPRGFLSGPEAVPQARAIFRYVPGPLLPWSFLAAPRATHRSEEPGPRRVGLRPSSNSRSREGGA